MQKTFDSKKIIIYSDTGEKNKVIDILKKKCSLRKKRLEVSDYILSKDVAVERKTTSDFISSIIDGRLFKQINELKNNFPKPILIIEGESLFNNGRKIHPNAIRGAIASIATEYSLPIIWTVSQMETAEILFSIAKREQAHIKNTIAIRGKKKTKSSNEEQLFLIAGLPKVNNKIAKNLLKYFGSPEAVFTASETELQKVGGVGKEMSKRIKKLLEKEYEKSILEG
ncbi:ERCC4 domain-containing protein [Candidatus Aenigmatarchaeota archaeon]